jgi:transcriptional regulator of acetoin/glycerol metabolism
MPAKKITPKKKPVKKTVKKVSKNSGNGRTSNESKNKENLLIALEKTLGNVSQSCKKVGISRRTFYDLKKLDPDFSKAVDEVKEVIIDIINNI